MHLRDQSPHRHVAAMVLLLDAGSKGYLPARAAKTRGAQRAEMRWHVRANGESQHAATHAQW